MTEVQCRSCRSISGEERISPGPTIAEGNYWVVEHAYPCALMGWLVLVLKRHAAALHELTGAEFAEMATLLEKITKLLSKALDCEKEYVMCLAEAEGFQHVHFHVVPRPKGIVEELKGPRIFAMLKVSLDEAVPPGEVKALCERLKQSYSLNL
ncbi:MAG: HIT family protein [Chloroflexota bacterium]|nr:HIT family protein [Chloroflexota bacterium]